MTLAEYEAIPESYRSVWDTERTDWQDWNRVRNLYMGKRGMLRNNALWIEGINFVIKEADTCQAENKDHAQEQAENAHPGCVLIRIKPLPQIMAGSTVWWTDPDNGLSSGRYQVLKVLTENGTVEDDDDLIYLANETGSQVEALAHEISSPPSIEELAAQLLNSESDEGCEGGYTVVNQRLLLNLIYEIQHPELRNHDHELAHSVC